MVPTALLRATACAAAGIDDWLFEECYQAVGDLAETIAHVLPPPAPIERSPLAEWVEQRLLPLRGAAARRAGRAAARDTGTSSTPPGASCSVKLIGGGFRVGVSKLLVQRALAEHAGLDAKRVAQRMMGYTDAAKRRRSPSASRR